MSDRTTMIAELRAELADLNRAADEDGTSCFWCEGCGNGDVWYDDIVARALAAGISEAELTDRKHGEA